MPQELVGLEEGVRRGVVTGWMERIDFEGRDLVACKIEKFRYYRLLGVICWDIFDSKAMTLPRNHFSFPKKSGSEMTISLHESLHIVLLWLFIVTVTQMQDPKS